MPDAAPESTPAHIDTALDAVLATAAQYHRNCLVLGAAHYIAGKKASQRHRWIGIPAVIASAMIGTSIFANLLGQADAGRRDAWAFVALGLTVLVAVLSALQTFFGFAELAARHQSAAASYAELRRQLDMFLLRAHGGEYATPGDAVDVLEPLGRRLSDLAGASPDVAERHYDAARRQIAENGWNTRSDPGAPVVSVTSRAGSSGG